jgi:hypothetical protein
MPRSLNLYKNKHTNYKSKRQMSNTVMTGGTSGEIVSKTGFELKDCIYVLFEKAINQKTGASYMDLFHNIDAYNNINPINNVSHILGVILRSKLDFEIMCITNCKDKDKSRITYELSTKEVSKILELRVPTNIYLPDVFGFINKPLGSNTTINMVEMITIIYKMYLYKNTANAEASVDGADGADGECNVQSFKKDTCFWVRGCSTNTSSIWTDLPDKLLINVKVDE